jgi:hypothetical protein
MDKISQRQCSGRENLLEKEYSEVSIRILHLTVTKKWFDILFSGEKKEEYRGIKPYWETRLQNGRYAAVTFRNGYSGDSPVVTRELLSIERGVGRVEWGAPKGREVFIIKLGEVFNGK